MTNHPTSVGLTLSGGGMRAIVFHLGVMKYLAEAGLWERIKCISTVSGGSLAIAVLLASNRDAWPNSSQIIEIANTRAKELLTTVDLEHHFWLHIFARPWSLISPKGKVLARLLRKHWGITQSLQDLPDTPEIFINCTTYETGKNWRFTKQRMGDYLTGYINSPTFPLADAVAASAAYPGYIGPLQVDLANVERTDSPYGDIDKKQALKRSSVWLWDGGLYENLGVEPLFKSGNLQRGVDFLIVSDASGQLGIEKRRWSWKLPFFVPFVRIAEIATDQTRALRVRDLMRTFVDDTSKGRFLYVANSTAEIFRKAKQLFPSDLQCQHPVDVKACAQFPTNLKVLSPTDYKKLLQRGYEVADATFRAYPLTVVNEIATSTAPLTSPAP